MSCLVFVYLILIHPFLSLSNPSIDQQLNGRSLLLCEHYKYRVKAKSHMDSDSIVDSKSEEKHGLTIQRLEEVMVERIEALQKTVLKFSPYLRLTDCCNWYMTSRPDIHHQTFMNYWIQDQSANIWWTILQGDNQPPYKVILKILTVGRPILIEFFRLFVQRKPHKRIWYLRF